MNTRVPLRICFLLLSLAVAATASAGEPLNRIVAFVNNDVITLHELNEKIKELTGMTPVQLREKNEVAFQNARKQIIDLMINEKITEAKIKELKIQVTQKELDETVEKIKAQNRLTQEDFIAALQKDGLTYEKFLEKAKRDIQRFQLINSEVKSKIIITDDRIKKYYEENRAKFTSDAKVHLAGIILFRKNAGEEENASLLKRGEEILEFLKRGEPFEEVAKKYSEGSGAEGSGDLGTFRISQLDPELQKLMSELPVGENTGVIERKNGIQIIKLLQREGGEQRSLEEVKDAIYSALYEQEVNERYAAWIKELREKSYTKIIF